jgi:hypothetical protein
MIRDGAPPLVLDESDYETLDPEALYSISSIFHIQGVHTAKHNRFDKAWGNRCRTRLMNGSKRKVFMSLKKNEFCTNLARGPRRRRNGRGCGEG